ncbi:putative reverse transcriptase domain-containing protein [Tanacetum coccineum]
MGHGTWYYSLGVSSIVDAFVRSEFGISSCRGSRVDGRTYLQSGAIDGSEANGIIRDPKLELESSRFTFDLVPLSYESVDVVVGENWLLRHKAEMEYHEDELRLCDILCQRQEVWNDCRSCKVRVGSNGNLLWEASVLYDEKKGCVMDTLKFTAMPFGLTNAPTVFMEVNESGGIRVAREDDRGVSERREDVREVFQQRGSGAKRKLSRCGRNQMGNEPILALPEGADDFVVYYDARSKDLEACLKKGRRIEHEANMMDGCYLVDFLNFEPLHLGKANLDVVPWSRKKE